MKPPNTKKGLRKYDHLTAESAVLNAWRGDGINPARGKREVGTNFPAIAELLTRLSHPVTGRGDAQYYYRELERLWSIGPIFDRFRRQKIVGDAMPLLARALDRLGEEG